jgi:Fe-S-cluster containining protein
MHPREQYPRTVCDCEECRRPCFHLPGMLAPGDLERISDYLAMPLSESLPMFRASPGAKVAKQTATGLHVFRIPTIVPAQDDRGRCVFLQSDERCRIHAVAPYGCTHFDWHMDREVADPRSAACLRAILDDTWYQEYGHTLRNAGLTTEGPEEKRQKMKERA